MFHFRSHKTSENKETMPSGEAFDLPKPAKPGHPGNLNPGQQHQLDKFRSDIQQKVCRFLRARKWDLAAAEAMFIEAENWRKENKVDELYATFTFPEKEAVSKLYPKFYHKVDNEGRPVYIEQLGNLNIKKLFEVTTPERLIQQLIVEYERFQRERLPVCSEARHELLETSCTIMDLKNVGVSQFWKVSSYVQQASRIGQYYYPETMGRFFIINAPYIFTTVWAVIKGWLDPVTTEKIQILGSNPVTELGKQIPLDNLPAIIGGKCNCPGGCTLSDAGPWNTPEGEEIIKRVNEEKQKRKEEYEHGGTSQGAASGAIQGAEEHKDRERATAGRGAAGAVSGGATDSGAPASAPADPSGMQSTPHVSPAKSTLAHPSSSDGLAPPLTSTAELNSPAHSSEGFQLSNSCNGELAPPITQS